MSPKGYMCRRRNIRGLSVMLFFLLVISLFQAAGEEAWECICGSENYDSPYCLICGCKPHLSMEEKAEYVPQAGDKIRFGALDSDYYSQEYWIPEPPLWTIMETDGMKALVLSDYGYDNVVPVDDIYRNDPSWPDSFLREWLNSEFINTLFNEAEQAVIVRRTATDGGYKTKDGARIKENETEDRIVVFSYEEAMKYLPSNEQRSLVDDIVYRKDRGDLEEPFSDGGGYYGWWLRSIGEGGEWYIVDPYGEIFSYKEVFPEPWNGDVIAVRPALWVDFEKLAESRDTIIYEVAPFDRTAEF